MNCLEFKRHMDDFIEGRMEDSLKKEMAGHMAVCLKCREEYENTKFIVEVLKKDASSIALEDKQRKDIKEIILKAPVKKYRDGHGLLRKAAYAAAIFMFLTAGIYFSGGIRINIGSGQNNTSVLEDRIGSLEAENSKLKEDIIRIETQNMELKSYVKDLESGKNRDWMMINANLGEAIIEGRVISVDAPGKKIKLEVYMDDNTPNIDPDVTIPDNIMISRVEEGTGVNKYTPLPGSINDLKSGDHITMHYMGDSKSARAIILYK